MKCLKSGRKTGSWHDTPKGLKKSGHKEKYCTESWKMDELCIHWIMSSNAQPKIVLETGRFTISTEEKKYVIYNVIVGLAGVLIKKIKR